MIPYLLGGGATGIDIVLFAAVASKSGSQNQILHDSLYVVLVAAGGVLLWAVQQFFGSMISWLGSRSADSVAAGLARWGRIAGGRLRRYRRAIQRNYAGHALGISGTEVIDIRAVYVPLHCEEVGRREDIYARIRNQPRSVVVGPAGAGKSLLLKNSMLIWADDSRMRPWHRGDRRVPVLVELHRCNDSDAGIPQFVLEELDRNQVRRSKSFVERALRDGQLRLLLDGLDEVGKDRQERVISMIRDFTRANPECQVVVTCRDTAYHGQLLPEFQHVVRIAEFDDASIRRLLGNWPGLDRRDVDNLVGTLRANPQLMLLARSPLLLTMIGYLYVSRFAKSGRSLPGSRVTFYEMAVTHLLGRDEALARAASVSAYEVGDKLAVLQRIAVAMQEGAASGQADRREISQAEAIAATRSVLPDINLDEGNAKPLFTEIVDRSQLLISLDQLRSRYSFRHLSLRDFLVARELADRPGDLLHGYAADPDGWREVVKLWCGVTTGNSTAVIREVLAVGSPRHQVLALECLAEAKYVDDTFAREVIGHFTGMLGTTGGTGQVLIAGFGALAAADGPRGRSVLRHLTGLADPAMATAGEGARRAAIAALCASGRQEAAEVLARLAPLDEAARAALRTMGELAIPVLEHQVATGDARAVDDLASIGTPAAAESLAGFIRVDDPSAQGKAAVAAAWRLAELLAMPDVEEGLKNSSFQIPDRTQTYDWVWKPFALPGAHDGPIGWIVGRIAFLIDQNPGFAPRVTRDVDHRIAIPLVSIMVSARVKDTPSKTLTDIGGTQPEKHFREESRSQSPQSERSSEIGYRIIRALKMPPAHEALMLQLPWPVLAQLLAEIFTTRIQITSISDWLEIHQEPKSARPLWVAIAILFVLAILISIPVSIEIFLSLWHIEVMRDAAHLTPLWLYIPTLCLFGTGICLFLGGGVWFMLAGNDSEAADQVADTGWGICEFALLAAVVENFVVGGLRFSGWFGPAYVTWILAIAMQLLLFWLAILRVYRYGNPLRHLLQASGRSFADRTSVIAK